MTAMTLNEPVAASRTSDVSSPSKLPRAWATLVHSAESPKQARAAA